MNELVSKLGIDWKLLLAQIVNFAVLFWLLKRFAFGPLGSFLRERSKKIEKGLKDADFVSAQRKNLKTLKAKMMAEGQKEVQTMMAEARVRSQAEADAMFEKAKLRKDDLVSEARRQIQEEKEHALKEAKQELGRLVLFATEKVLREKVDKVKDREIVDKALKDLR